MFGDSFYFVQSHEPQELVFWSRNSTMSQLPLAGWNVTRNKTAPCWLFLLAMVHHLLAGKMFRVNTVGIRFFWQRQQSINKHVIFKRNGDVNNLSKKLDWHFPRTGYLVLTRFSLGYHVWYIKAKCLCHSLILLEHSLSLLSFPFRYISIRFHPTTDRQRAVIIKKMKLLCECCCRERVQVSSVTPWCFSEGDGWLSQQHVFFFRFSHTHTLCGIDTWLSAWGEIKIFGKMAADETKIMQRKRNERTKQNSWNRESRGLVIDEGEKKKKNFLKTGEVKKSKNRAE